MRVWELMAKLSKCQADAEVWVGIPGFFNVPLESFEYDESSDDEPFVELTSETGAEPIG